MNITGLSTRAGNPARLVARVKHSTFPLVAAISTGDYERVVCLTERGYFYHDETPHDFDVDLSNVDPKLL